MVYFSNERELEMKNVRSICILISGAMVSLFAAIQCLAQTPGQTGLPPWTSFASDGFGSVDLANLNIHLEIPLRSLPGRGFSLNARLVSDTNTLGPPGSLFGPGSQVGWKGTGVNYIAGTPYMGNFVGLGFKPGYIAYSTTSTNCTYNSTIYTFYVYSNFTYLDNHGTLHTFNPNIQVAGLVTLLNGSQIQCPGFTPASGWGTNIQYGSDDGSGYVLFLTSGAGAPAAYVYDVSTAVTNDSTDANGNSNTFNGYSNAFTNATLTDSSGNAALIVNSNLSGSPYSTTFSYLGPDGNNRNILVTWSPFTGTGAVNCPGIPNPTSSGYPSSSGYRVSSIALPDGTSYGFTYEPVLGRPQTITLPTGGQISYNWNGPNAGISCLDGGSSGFTKTTQDGVWTYARSYSSTTQVWTTTVTDPLGDQTVYTFGSSATTYPAGTPLPAYEIQRKVYQKVSASQVLLKTVVTCYNGNFTNCASTPFPF